MDESTTLARRLPRSPRELRVWAYVLALSIVAAVGWALVTHNTTPHAEPHLPCVAGRVPLGFAAAELCVVHVALPAAARTPSASPTLPFVFGLVFA